MATNATAAACVTPRRIMASVYTRDAQERHDETIVVGRATRRSAGLRVVPGARGSASPECSDGGAAFAGVHDGGSARRPYVRRWPTCRRVVHRPLDRLRRHGSTTDEWNVQEPRPTGHVFVQARRRKPATAASAHDAAPSTAHFRSGRPMDGRLAFVREEAIGRSRVVWDAERDRLTPVGDAFRARGSTWRRSGIPTGKTLSWRCQPDGAAPAPYRVRSVKSTDARIPGDQFFTDERKALAGRRSTQRAARSTRARGRRRSCCARSGCRRRVRMLLYVAPDPATLGVIGKEQNDSFVLPVDLVPARSRRPLESWPIADATRGRLTANSSSSRKAGRLMVVAGGGRRAEALARVVHASAVNRPGRRTGRVRRRWSPTRRCSIRSSSRSSPACTRRRRPFNDVYVVGGDGTARNITRTFEDQTSDLAWSADGAALYFRATNNKTYDETLYRYTVADGDARSRRSADRSRTIGSRRRRAASSLRSRMRRTRPTCG